jgi:hypothetical protein
VRLDKVGGPPDTSSGGYLGLDFAGVAAIIRVAQHGIESVPELSSTRTPSVHYATDARTGDPCRYGRLVEGNRQGDHRQPAGERFEYCVEACMGDHDISLLKRSFLGQIIEHHRVSR